MQVNDVINWYAKIEYSRAGFPYRSSYNPWPYSGYAFKLHEMCLLYECRLWASHNAGMFIAYQRLTHWGRDRMDAISQTTISSAFSWMKMFELRSISLRIVPKGSINTILALVQIMAWCRPGDKPLSEPMMVRLPTHKCVTRPRWGNLQLCYRKF